MVSNEGESEQFPELPGLPEKIPMERRLAVQRSDEAGGDGAWVADASSRLLGDIAKSNPGSVPSLTRQRNSTKLSGSVGEPERFDRPRSNPQHGDGMD